MKQIGALWLKESQKDGKKFYSGILEAVAGLKTPIVIFKNDKKEKENHPDYYIYLSEKFEKKQDEEQSEPDAGPDVSF